jgi:hypothetical protein
MGPDAKLAAAAEDRHGIFARRHALAAGLTEKQIEQRLEAGLWKPVFHSAYRITGAPESWRGRLLAACWAGGFRAVASHRSASALWGLAGGRRSIPEVSCPRWQRGRHDGIVVHETKAVDPVDLTSVAAIPVTTPERTLLDLGAVCHESVVEMALDASESRGLVSGGSLRRTLARLGRPGRNGAGVLRRLLIAHFGRPAVPESEMETMLFQVLRRNGLPEPVPQYEIRDNGVFVARVDAAYPELRIAIEYDSAKHHAGRRKLICDNERRNRLWAVGWFPVTATFPDLKNGGAVLCSAIRGARRRAS